MIRKLTRLFAAVTLLFIGGKTFAQTEKDTVYVFLQDMPDAGIYLPPPPDMLSPQYADDFAQWQWGKSVRPTDRGQQANDDSQWGIKGMIRVHQETLGFEITKEKTPATEHTQCQAQIYAHPPVCPVQRAHMGPF